MKHSNVRVTDWLGGLAEGLLAVVAMALHSGCEVDGPSINRTAHQTARVATPGAILPSPGPAERADSPAPTAMVERPALDSDANADRVTEGTAEEAAPPTELPLSDGPPAVDSDAYSAAQRIRPELSSPRESSRAALEPWNGRGQRRPTAN